jgi:hypothetical protein
MTGIAKKISPLLIAGLHAARSSANSYVASRIRFIARFIYWSVRHRSPRNAAWVCEYEGFKW